MRFIDNRLYILAKEKNESLMESHLSNLNKRYLYDRSAYSCTLVAVIYCPGHIVALSVVRRHASDFNPGSVT